MWFSFIHPWNNGGVVGCDGVLYWLTDVAPTFIRCAIIALNPIKGTDDENQRRFIDPPADLYPLLKINLTSWGSPFKWSVNLFLGACQSRLRLARLPVKGSNGIEVLRVWEMKDYNDNDNGTSTYSWHVVHEVYMHWRERHKIYIFWDLTRAMGMLYSCTSTVTFIDITLWKMRCKILANFR